MTSVVVAISMHIAGLAALVTSADHFIADPFSQPVVENKILSFEFICKMLFLHFVGVLNDTAFKMENIFETIMKHISAGFLATDTACAIHDYVLIFFFFEHIYSHG